MSGAALRERLAGANLKASATDTKQHSAQLASELAGEKDRTKILNLLFKPPDRQGVAF